MPSFGVDIGIVWTTQETGEVEVNYTVSNSGNENGDTDVWLTVDGPGMDDVEVDRDEDVHVYTWSDSDGEVFWLPDDEHRGEEYSVTVHVDGDDESRTVDIPVSEEDEEEAEFFFGPVAPEISYEPVAPGSTLEVWYQLGADGDIEGSTDVWLEANGTEVDRHEDVEVDPDPVAGSDSKTGYLHWETDSGDEGPATLGLFCDDDNVEFVTNIQEPPDEAEYTSEGFIEMNPHTFEEAHTWDSVEDWEDYEERDGIDITEEGSLTLAEFPEPARMHVTGFGVETEDPEAGDRIDFSWSIANGGDETGTTDVWMEVDEYGEVDRIEDIELDPSHTQISISEDDYLQWASGLEGDGTQFATLYTNYDQSTIEFEIGDTDIDMPSEGHVLYSGSWDSTVKATNADDGSEFWTYEYHEDPDSESIFSIFESDGVVYFGTSQDEVIALDSVTGSYLWEHELHDGSVYGVFELDGVLYSGDTNETVIAYDIDTGSEIWSHDHHSEFVTEVHASDGVVYSGSRDNKVIATDAEDGSELWEHELHDDWVITVFESGGVVYSGSSDEKVIAVDAEDGSELWEHELHDDDIQSVFESDGVVYSGGDDNSVFAVNAGDGSELWENDHHTGTVYRVVEVLGIVYSSDSLGNIIAYDVADDSVLWDEHVHDNSNRISTNLFNEIHR